MSNPHPTRILIATAGLELLPATRLKMACSLLAADRLEAGLVEWGSQPVSLLVADEGSAQGRVAIASARQQRLRVITLGRMEALQVVSEALPHTASVREIALALKGVLIAPVAAVQTPGTAAAPAALPRPASGLPPLLEQLRLDQPRQQTVLLEHGLLRLVVEAGGNTLHMLRRMPMAHLVEQALEPDWRITVLSDQEWQRSYRPDVSVSHAIETVWWQLAAAPAFEPPVMTGRPLELAAWPDLDPANADPQWPLLLSFLMHRPWLPGELSMATGLSQDMVKKVMALVQLSGLSVQEGGRRRERMRVRAPASTGQARSFLRIAKRFGLKLLGLQHG
jgi:hypothetical protein